MEYLGWEKENGKTLFTVAMTKAEAKVILKGMQGVTYTERQSKVADGILDTIIVITGS